MSTQTAEFTITHQRTFNRRGPVRWVLHHLLPYWYLVVMMSIGAFGNAALAAVVPVYIGRAFDLMLSPARDLKALAALAVFVALSQVVRGVLQLGRNFGAELIGQRMERDIRDELYLSLLGKSMTFHSLQPVGDTMARATNDVREINLMFSPGINLVVGSANFLIMPLVLAPRYHPALMLTPALFIVAYALALWQYLHELAPITDDVRSAFGRMNTRLAEALDGVETVKGAAQEYREIGLFERNARRFRDAFVRQGDVEARFLPLLLMGIAEAGGLLHALYLFRAGALQVGDVVAYFGLLQLFGFPTFVSLFAYSQVSSGLAGARRILELINRENNLDQNAAGYASPLRGEVVFHNVSFAYPDGERVLEDISFRVHPGQTVAIVGQTGAGKTTLTRLINRTYDVDAGQVLVDGVDVREWQLDALRGQISFIEQDIFLFSRSIAENIAFGRPDASREEIIAAAKAAQAHEFIMTFEHGYDTVIGERGVTLSGGQRQRLALARAFLTAPGILVLDDSTSAIDSATEDKIQQAIAAASRGRTTFIITHRLSQIRWADLILVLRKGRLVAQGSHETLMQTSPAYRRIFDSSAH
ncbi:MAG: ABC transporter ATP-binding protein [Anaerolineae bacterium]|nr:MAG: ABC transporter ATP-binding protein [Anaerolineae bacterium]